MEFIINQELTNIRAPKEAVAEVIVTPTNGNFRVSPTAAKQMGLQSGDYLGLVVGTVPKEDGSGNEQGIFLFKGFEVKGQMKGSKLNGKDGAGLNCSSANAWNQLGGDGENSIHYNVEETPAQKDGVNYFRIRKGNVVPKPVRKTAEAAV